MQSARAHHFFSVLLVLMPLSVACNQSGSAPGTMAFSTQAFDAEEIQQDIKTGKLKFEVRGLTNEVQEKSYGGKSFTHSAIIIPVGDSKYTKGDYLLLCSVKRLSGGDPDNPRKNDSVTVVYGHDGRGRLDETGGYRSKDEKWEPEKIELRPEAVFVGISAVGASVQE